MREIRTRYEEKIKDLEANKDNILDENRMLKPNLEATEKKLERVQHNNETLRTRLDTTTVKSTAMAEQLRELKDEHEKLQ